MYTNIRTSTRVVAWVAAALVHIAIFVGTERSIENAAVFGNDGPVAQLEPVIVTAPRTATTAGSAELSAKRCL
jgi:hypothetical protein